MKDILTINSEHTIKEVKLMSLSGQSLQVWKNQHSLDLSGYSKGIYLLHIDTDKGTSVNKIVKK